MSWRSGGRGATTNDERRKPAAPPVVMTCKHETGIDGHTTLSIANYWPYATTLFDYIKRARCRGIRRREHSTDDQVPTR